MDVIRAGNITGEMADEKWLQSCSWTREAARAIISAGREAGKFKYFYLKAKRKREKDTKRDLKIGSASNAKSY